jgi:subfamily B ATP-binding cassette protein MsbA
MKNFRRTLRLALQYRLTFGASLVCALMVAVLWGGNITAVYPIVEIALQRRSLHEWSNTRVVAAEQKAAQIEQFIAETDRQIAAAVANEAAHLKVKKRDAEARLADAQTEIKQDRWLRDNVVVPYLPEDPFQTLVLVVGLILLGTVVKSVFFVGHQVLVSRLTQLAIFNLRKEFYRRTLDLDLATFGADGNGSSELMSRFTYDMESLSSGLNEILGKMVREPLKMMACLIGAGLICWRLLFFSLIVAPVAAWVIHWLARTLKSANRRAMEEMSQMYSILEETFQGIKVVKAFTMERYERRRFHLNSKKFFTKSMRIARYDSLTRPMTELMGILTICLALLAGAYLVIEQKTELLYIKMCDEPLSLSMLMVFYGLLAGISDPARKLSEVFSRIQRGVAASDRIYQLIDREPAVVEAKRAQPLRRHTRELSFEGIEFHYESSHRVLEEINLRIPFGETIAIVGPNGCGKSTLANLIPRFFDPVKGSVKLDGVDLRNVRLRELRSQIGLVTQETLLFDDTVFNNIRYGSPHATRQEVIEAAQQAHAHRFIEDRLENGYNSVVGPRGNLLSGGQRQRIALARAILRDPTILILDEATSQVDLESEQVIQKVLEQFVHNRTTVIITHRMGTLALADRIVVMNSGRILDFGTHNELLRRCPLYSRLYAIQFKEIA